MHLGKVAERGAVMAAGPYYFRRVSGPEGRSVGRVHPVCLLGPDCGDRVVRGGREWVCSRPRAHGGAHVAHVGGAAVAAWILKRAAAGVA